MIIVLKILLPLLLFAGVTFGLSTRFPVPWFSVLSAGIVFYSVMAILKKGRLYTFVSLFMGGLLIAGLIGFTERAWLHIAYIPYVVAVSMLFSGDMLLMLAFSVPVFEIRHLLLRGRLYEELALLGFVFVSAGITHFFFYRMKREKERLSSSLKSLKDSAMEDLSGEALISRGMALGMEFDGEIRDILDTIRHTVGPDTVSLFVPLGGRLGLRCSTPDAGVEVSDKGVIHLAFERKETVSVEGRENYSPGYIRKGRVSSVAAVPVMDGGIAVGVLSADSGEPGAFGEAEIEALRMFSRQIARTLKNQRVYAEMERSHLGLKVLQEESARLTSSLKLKALIQEIIEGGRRIAPLGMAFFMKTTAGHVLAGAQGMPLPSKRRFDLEGTLIGTALKNREHIYIPDLRGYAMPVLPFEAGMVQSAFILPLSYEADTAGMMVFVSEETDSLTTYQIELLEVFGNQASISLKNAMLHANIERMATTDSLTGLFNHRHFQERLSLEFKRLERFAHPLSLLLIDIDFFKKVNDTYGHPAGDEVLRQVADIIRKTLRAVDLPARYGGEEFAALLVGTDRNGAALMAERLRQTVMDLEFQADGKKLKITISTGIATAPEDAGTKEGLIDKADKSLYRAKKAGRNRVVLWDGEAG